MSKRIKFRFQYTFKAKAEFLYNYVSTPYNLAIWFCDDARNEDNKIIFTWNNSEEKAKIQKEIFKKKIEFRWIDRPGNESLSFVIDSDEITGGTVLVVSDFDEEDQVEEARMWWDNAIQKLKRVIGG